MNRSEVLLLCVLEMHSTLLVCQDDTCTPEPWTLASLDHFRTCPHKEKHLHSQDLVSSVLSSWQTSGQTWITKVKSSPKQLKNSREGRCVTRMFRGPILVDMMMGS